MAVCETCGTSNDEGRSTCVRCGLRLDEPAQDGLAVLRRLGYSGVSDSDRVDDAVIEETPPDWLELLLARYGEDMPAFVGTTPVAVGPGPASGPAMPRGTMSAGSREGAMHTAGQVAEAGPSTVETAEVPEWLTELENARAEISGRRAPAALAVPDAEEPALSQPVGVALEGVDRTAGRPTDSPEGGALQVSEPTASEAGISTSAPLSPGEEVPDWLTRLRAAGAGRMSPPSGEPDTREDMEEAPPTSGILEGTAQRPASPPTTALEGATLAAAGAAGDEDEVPDWLADIQREAAAATAAPSPGAVATSEDAGETQEGPDWWMREIGLGGASGPSVSARTGTSPSAEAPASPPVPETLLETPDEQDIPDWLSRLVATSSDETIPSPPVEPEMLPAAWQPATKPMDEMERVSSAEMSPDEVLDWLREIEMAQAAREGAPSLPPVEPAASKTTVAGQDTPVTASSDLLVEGAAEDSDLPRWLADLEAMVEHPLEREVPVAAESGTLPSPPSEEPEWLREIEAASSASLATPAAASSAEVETAEIPKWMARFRPPEADRIARVEHHPQETTTPLEAEQAKAADNVLRSLRDGVDTPQVPDVEGASAFAEIVEEKAEAVPVPEQRSRRGSLSSIIWALIFVVILLGIAILALAVFGRVQNLLGAPAFRNFLQSPAAAGLVSSLEVFREHTTTLPEDAVVLMSVDYTAATEAEMEPLAEMVLRDLLTHRARVVTVSLQPQGAALAQRLLDRLDGAYPYGERTLNLGYLSGEAAGVRSATFIAGLPLFADGNVEPGGTCQTLADCPAWLDVRGLEDVHMVVEVADAAQPVRWWVEQVAGTSLADRPLLAAVSAAAAPGVRPYYSGLGAAGPGRLQGLISGVTAAAAYEVWTGQPGRALRSMAAQSVAHLGLVVVALAGTLSGFRRRVVARSRS
jgi:hypothetical protein